MLLSIIVPVFGVEKYILDFAESLIHQLNDDCELIIVNDGTKDNSIEILKRYIQTFNFIDKNIFILEQVNQGQSVARNTGIKNSRGQYIAFLDSDDKVSSNFVSTLISNIIENKNIDIFHLNASIFEDQTEKKIGTLKLVNDNLKCIKNDTYLKQLFMKNLWYPWMRVIKRSILIKYKFTPDVFLEDLLIFPEIYNDDVVKYLKNIDQELVFYRERPNSSIRNIHDIKLINGIDLGLMKYSNKQFNYHIIYNYLFMIKIKNYIYRGGSLFGAYALCIKNDHIFIDYSCSKQLYLLKYFPFLYVTLLKCKKLFF